MTGPAEHAEIRNWLAELKAERGIRARLRLWFADEGGLWEQEPDL